MRGYNKVIIMGNLTRDVELTHTTKGTAKARISMAVNRQWRTDAGETKEEVTFVDVEAWGKQAETIAQYIGKGKPLFVEGRLKQDIWDDKQTGQKKSKMNVVLESFQFVGDGGSKTSQDASKAQSQQTAKVRPQDVPPANFGQAQTEDDVPF